MNHQESGRQGEAVAARYYLNRGYHLLDHNYKTRQGELDLVLQKGEQIVIAEVKTRSGQLRYAPSEAVGAAKQKRLILAAQRYLQVNGLLDCPVRFDVVEIVPQKEGGFWVHCIMDAFQL